MERKQNTRWRTVVVLVLFGVAFGYIEAAVVVYLRAQYEPLALELYPERRPGDLFPLITLEQLEAIRWDVKTNAVQRVEHVYRMPPMEYPVAIPKSEIRYTTARRMVGELARRAWYPFTAAASDEVRRGWRYD